LPLEVVLPDPCRPTIMMQLGLPAERQTRIGRTQQADQFVVNNFDDLLSGLNALDDPLAEGLDFDLLDESLTTLKLTSASSNAMRTSRRASETLDSEILPNPRRFRKAFCNFWLNESNMVII